MASSPIPEDEGPVVYSTDTAVVATTVQPVYRRAMNSSSTQSRAVSRSRPSSRPISGHPSRPGSRPASRPASRPGSILSNTDKCDVMVKYLLSKCRQSNWVEQFDLDESYDENAPADHAVFVRRSDGSYSTEPVHVSESLVLAVEMLGAAVAFTMSSPMTAALLEQVPPLQSELYFGAGAAMLPIVNSIEELASGAASVSPQAYMCLCREEEYVLLWSNSVPSILAHAGDVETRIMGLVWGSPIANPTPLWSPTAARQTMIATPQSPNVNPYFPNVLSPSAESPRYSVDPGLTYLTTESADKPELKEKIQVIQTAIEREELGDRAFDPEKESQAVPPRQFLLTHAASVGLAMVLVVLVEMAVVSKLLEETRYDGAVIRWSLVFTIPIFASFSIFFMIVITGSVFQLFGPLTNVNSNSIFFSAKAPKPERHPDYELPHITIQVPVFKEGLKGVIIPTLTSLIASVRNYEARGGTASIYVNEDGMQVIPPHLAEARKAFYEVNNIGWCARPAHYTGPESTKAKKGGWFWRKKREDAPPELPETSSSSDEEKMPRPIFVRKGKFKKASNMNYCLDFSIRVEDELQKRLDAFCEERGCPQEALTIDEEMELYEQAREKIVADDEGRTMAAGDVRIGEIILIVDSDTRVPADCLLYAALEMHESPEVALLQHSSSILQTVNNVFEKGITYFTELIYNSIVFAVGNGDVAPFVGHNTFIRWKALQSIGFEEDERTKFWSESHVSEDFDVSLRLQLQNFIIRLATYHNGGFKEGVSLTIYDELARWEKYAYGCNELVFHPFAKWWRRGPFTPLFRKFVWSNIKITSKMTIYAYIFTYYAIASALPLSVINYALLGLFGNNVDQFYIASWKIFVGMAIIFNVLSPFAYAMLRHRLGQKTFFWSLVESYKWLPMFLLFFGGISFHLSKAILCHFFSINIEWTATAKELEKTSFRVGLDRVISDFKWMYAVIIPLAAGMVYVAVWAPWGWTITDFTLIVPLANQIGCHALLPFALGLF